MLQRLIPALGAQAVLSEYLDYSSRQSLFGHKDLATEVGTRTPVKELLAMPMSQEILLNDGSATYLMHGTTTEEAARITQEGLKLKKRMADLDMPDLHFTAKMMPAANEQAARQRIIHGITYRPKDTQQQC